MKMNLQCFWFRLLVSASVASVVIVGLVGTAIRYYEPPEESVARSPLEFVKVVNLADNPALAEAVRRERERNGTVRPEHEPPPPPMLRPERQVSGFVQLEYTINADGTVSDVRVVSAAPRGVYEKEAIERVSRTMHAPVFNDAGEAVARRTSEVIEFSVPSSALQKGSATSR